jgi:hypothetical protein
VKKCEPEARVWFPVEEFFPHDHIMSGSGIHVYSLQHIFEVYRYYIFSDKKLHPLTSFKKIF